MSQETKKDLLNLGRLAELGKQTAILIHEMRQPVTAIQAALQLTTDSDGVSQQELIQEALGQVARFSKLLDQAANLTSTKRKPTTFAIKPLVERLLTLFKGALEKKHVDLVLHLDALAPVTAVSDQVEQILYNLINNARESLLSQGHRGRLILILRAREAQAELIIADDGVGVDETRREAIFKPHVSDKEGGTGLGLYNARALAEENSGELVLLTDEQLRTLLTPPPITGFALRLPLAAEETEARSTVALEAKATEPEALDTQASSKPDAAEDSEARSPAAFEGSNARTSAATDVQVAPPSPRARAKHPSTGFLKILDHQIGDPLRAKVFGAGLLQQRRIENLLTPLGFELSSASTPEPVDPADYDLVITSVENGREDIAEIIAAIGTGDDHPALVAALEHWSTADAVQALELGCADVIQLPFHQANILAAKATISFVARRLILKREATALLEHWERNKATLLAPHPLEQQELLEKKINRIIKTDAPIPICAFVHGSPHFQMRISQVFKDVVSNTSDGKVEIDRRVDVLFFESKPEQLPLLLQAVPSFLLSNTVMCTEALSADEIRQALRSEIMSVVTGIYSSPLLFQRRLEVIARWIEAKKRYKGALAQIMPQSSQTLTTSAVASQKILVIDDDPVILKLLKRSLKGLGHLILGCSSGEEAMEILGQNKIDLLIADKNLADSTGIEIHRVAKQYYPEMLTLIITAFATQLSAEEALQLGANDYIVKPFELPIFLAKVKQLLNRQQVQQLPRPKGVVLAVKSKATIALLTEAFTFRDEEILATGPYAQLQDELTREDVGIIVLDLDLALPDQVDKQLQALLEVYPNRVIILLATRPDLDDTLRAFRMGASVMIHKPIKDIEVLSQKIAIACREACA